MVPPSISRRSELCLSLLLDMLGVKYKYNYPLYAQNHFYLADFFFPDSQDFHEHMGMLDHEPYAQNQKRKLEDYKTLGIQEISRFPISENRNDSSHATRILTCWISYTPPSDLCHSDRRAAYKNAATPPNCTPLDDLCYSDHRAAYKNTAPPLSYTLPPDFSAAQIALQRIKIPRHL